MRSCRSSKRCRNNDSVFKFNNFQNSAGSIIVKSIYGVYFLSLLKLLQYLLFYHPGRTQFKSFTCSDRNIVYNLTKFCLVWKKGISASSLTASGTTPSEASVHPMKRLDAATRRCLCFIAAFLSAPSSALSAARSP